MKFSKLKKNLLALELEEEQLELASNAPPTEVEVYSDSVQQALEVAAAEMHVELSQLDYEIHQKGTKGFFGFGRTPYKVIVRKEQVEDDKWANIEGMDVSLAEQSLQQEQREEDLNADGKFKIRIYKEGIFIKVSPAQGTGQPVTLEEAKESLQYSEIVNYDKKVLEKELKNPTNELVKIADWIPKPEADSTLTVEIQPSEMKAFVTISSPRPGGRHLQVSDVINALKSMNVHFGYLEDEIQKALDNDKYSIPIQAAQGKEPQHGQDAYIDYKVRIDKKISFNESKDGKIDFLEKNLVENVVQGEVLAVLVPETKGVPGITVTNKVIPANDGKPTELKGGKGTILSEDGKTLTAEKNGQVIFTGGKIHVEEVFTVSGDVGLETGNIDFLGSVIIRGAVTDNMKVRAAFGNIEVGGTVQKASLIAEQDIIVKQGVVGRDGALIESTTGSFLGKFVQNTHISVEKDVIVSEAILHSKIEAGGKVLCMSGKRGQIVAGEIMAGEEVRVKQLGAEAHTETKVTAGINPKILSQIKEMEKIQSSAQEKLEKIEQNIKTLNNQKESMGDAFPQDKVEMLVIMMSNKDKLVERLKEAEEEKKQLQDYLEMLSTKGKVHIEKTLFPGVTVEINGAVLHVKDEYKNVTLIEENGNIKITPYELSEEDQNNWRKRRKR